MQICKVLDSFSPKCSSARKVERCSRAKGYPRKIFSDNSTNIDTNSKKNVRIFWGGSVTTKTPIFCDPCFGSFSDEAPANGRHQTHNGDPRPQPIPKHTLDHPTSIPQTSYP